MKNRNQIKLRDRNNQLLMENDELSENLQYGIYLHRSERELRDIAERRLKIYQVYVLASLIMVNITLWG